MSAEAFRADGALSGSVAITRGPAPVAEYLEEMVLDLIVHAWDLGTAIGYPGPLPAYAVEAIYPLARAVVDRSPPACSTHRSRSVPTRRSLTSSWR